MLHANDHPCVKSEKYINFSDAITVLPASIEQLTGKLVTPDAPFSPKKMEAIINAAKAGKSMSEEFKKRI